MDYENEIIEQTLDLQTNTILCNLISYAKYNESKNEFSRAAEKYKKIAKSLFPKEKYRQAIYYYTKAAYCFENANEIRKEINCLLMKAALAKLISDFRTQADCLAIIATMHIFKLNEISLGATRHLESAHICEKMGNYIEAEKRADDAFMAFYSMKSYDKAQMALSVAIRNSIKANIPTKANYFISESYRLIKKDYSASHISLCLKGFHNSRKDCNYEQAYFYLLDIIKGHFEYKNRQRSISDYLINAIKMKIASKKELDQYCLSLLQTNTGNKELVYIYQDLINYANTFCDDETVSKLRILLNNNRLGTYFKSFNPKFLPLLFWKITCNYGESLFRWIVWCLSVVTFFGFVYLKLPVFSFLPSNIKNILCNLSPSFTKMSANIIPNGFYQSIIVFTTFGFGSIIPENTAAQYWLLLEYLIGYMSLGALISLFTKKIAK